MSDPTSAHASRPSSASGGASGVPSRAPSASGAAHVSSLRSSRSSSASGGALGELPRAPSAHANSLHSSRSSSVTSAHGASPSDGAAQAGSRPCSRPSLVGALYRAASQRFAAGASATDAIDEMKGFDRAVRESGATEAERQSALARLSSVTASRASRAGSPANEQPARPSAASSVSSRASTVARHSDAESPGRGATGVPPIVESDSSMVTARSEQVGRMHDEVKALTSRVTTVEARADALGADVKEHEASIQSLSERVSRDEALRQALSTSVGEQRDLDDAEFRDLRVSIVAVGDKVKAVANDLDRRVDKVARETEHLKLQAAKKPDDRVERLAHEVEGLRSLNAKLEARLEANENEVRSLRIVSSRDSARTAVEAASNVAIDDVRSTTEKLDDRLVVLEKLVLSEPWTVAQRDAQDALRATRSASLDREASERSSQRAAQQVTDGIEVRMKDLEATVRGLTNSLKVVNDTVARVRKEALADVNKLFAGTQPGVTTRSRAQSVAVDDDDHQDRLDRLSRRVNELPEEMKSAMLELLKADREHLARQSDVDAVRLELEQRNLAATATEPARVDGIPSDFERLDGAVATLKRTTDRRIDEADASLRAVVAKQADLQRDFDNFKARQQQQARPAGQALLMDDDGKRALERVKSLSAELSSHKSSVADRLAALERGSVVDVDAQLGELPADARRQLADLEETCRKLEENLTNLAVMVDQIEPATIAVNTMRELIAENDAAKTRPLSFCDTTIWTERVKTFEQLQGLQKRALAVLSEAKSSKKALVQNTKFAFAIPSQVATESNSRETTQYTVAEHLEKSCTLITALVDVAEMTAEDGVLNLSAENARVFATEFVRIAILQTAMVQERDPVRLKEQVKKFINLHGQLTANDFEKICTDEVQPNSWKPKADAQTTVAKRQAAPTAASTAPTARGRTPSPKRSATPARRTTAAASSPEFDAVMKSIQGKLGNGKPRVTLSLKQAQALVSGSNGGFGRGSA